MKLEEILAAKEMRYKRQMEFREQYELPLISITINMPGAIKDTPVIRRLRDYAVQELKQQLPIIAAEELNLRTGPTALLAVDGDGWAIKKKTIEIEEASPFARLLDIDVFEADGTLLSRQDHGQRGRGCFVCGGKTISCMREQKHSPEEIKAAVEVLLNHFKAAETRTISAAAEKIGTLAVEAMLYEVTCTPAPGLVDRVNSGAHHDMDFYSFMASSAALSPALARCAQAGLNHDGSADTLLPVLRLIGLDGEKRMLAVTKGVNTQKGLLFLLGILAGAAGWLVGKNVSLTAEAILSYTTQMVEGIVERELGCTAAKTEALTSGEKLYLEYGITGVRGELAEGLPAVTQTALPALKAALANGLSVNDALVQVLLILMTCVDDTTVMHRHHPDKMRIWVRQQVQRVLEAGGMETAAGRQQCQDMDTLFIEHNVSPGGVADLLAVTWFLHRLSVN